MGETERTRKTHGVGGSMLRYAPSRFIDPLLGVLAIPILTRVLEPDGYGDFKTVILTVGLLRIVGLDWINNCAIRFYRPMEGDLRRYYSNLLAGSVLGVTVLALLCVGMYALSAPWAGSDCFGGELALLLSSFVPWMFLAAVADGVVRNGEMSLRAMQRPLAFSVLRAGVALSRHGLGLVCLLLFSKSVAAYMGGWAVGAAVLAVVAWSVTGGLRRISPAALSPRLLREFLVFGFPITLVLLANAMQTTGTRYVLQMFAGSEATGLYSAAYDLGGVPVMLFQSIVMLGLYPLAIDAFEKDACIDGVARDGLRYFVLGAMPVVLLLALLAEPTITVFAGADYATAWPVLTICCVGTFAYGLSQYFSLWFLVTKRTGRWAAINLSAAAVNITLASILVPRYGYVSAAVATATAHVLILCGSVTWGLRPSGSNFPIRSSLRAVMACAPIVVIWLLTRRGLTDHAFTQCLVVCVTGGLAYAFALWLSGELTRELDVLRRLISNRRARKK